jgi:hypothetical protein
VSLRSRMAIVVGLASALVASVCAQAAPMQPVNGIDRPSMIIQVAGGCGPNGWRGPWGHCRSTPFYGRLPNGYYQPAPAAWNGCPEGYWRGPWGHCRNTPYHGRLPDGSWK